MTKKEGFEMSFAHLHVHTEFSILDGSNKIKEYVARVKELGMNSAAITDHGAMYGVIDFYRAAKAEGIKPILGCEVYVAPNSRFDREMVKGEDRYYHLVLLAENNVGYQNLIKIVSKGFTEGFYSKPRVDMEVLEQFSEGIISLSACLGGAVQRSLLRGNYEEAKEVALRYAQIFGENNFFLELQDHGMEEQALVNQQLLRLAKDTNLPLVATNDIHYTYADDAKPHDILLCIQTGKKLSDENRMRYKGGQYFVKSEEEMKALFPYALEALENTQKIADRCNVEIEFGVTKLPKYDVPDGMKSEEYLRKLSYAGLEKRYPNPDESLVERLEYELGVIQNMGYVDYFLIVWDFINYAKNQGIAVGPGRGSAAGSIVSFALEITDIDPIKYQLLFERFLNPERVSMPDVDIDFCVERRQEVIEYVREKYGNEQVVQIVTFGTMAARGVIRDVGRVMDIPYAAVDVIAKMIPQELNITIDKALQDVAELHDLYKNDEQVHELIEMSRKLEGLSRNISMHAAGVVISQLPVDEYVPLSRASDGSITTQFTMNTLEELGLLKMDFLGLRTLTVIHGAMKLIEKNHGIHIDLHNMDYNDKEVLATLGTGKNDGIFQLESAGMKSFMKELKPESLEDVIAGISLYRPGPMDFIPKYIRGKNDASAITYDCPQLEPILSATYGCIVYQEQVMQIVRDLAGYTLGRSDLLRRAMSKKKADVMEMERKNFVHGNEAENVPGCVANGISEVVANRIFDEMSDFAKYAFNKSHAAAYAFVAYQTAYLKHYYTVEYMASLMTSVIDNTTKFSGYIYACRKMGIQILPPDINEGDWSFTSSDKNIRYGLGAIKGVGRSVVEDIIRERDERGVFKNLKDFLERLSGKSVNKRTIESLIKAGALDSLEGTRKQQMIIYAQILDAINQEKKHSMVGQMTLFDMVGEEQKKEFEIKLPAVGEYEKADKLNFEKEVLGVYATGHPLEEYEERWKRTISATTLELQPDEETAESTVRDGEKVIIGGMIVETKIITTKRNQLMAAFILEDLVGTIEVIVFPREYQNVKQYIEADSKIFIKGNVMQEEDKPTKVSCEAMIPFDATVRKLYLIFPSIETYVGEDKSLCELLKTATGNDEVIIWCEKERSMKTLPKQYCIKMEPVILGKLRNKYGEDCVKVVEKPIEKFF